MGSFSDEAAPFAIVINQQKIKCQMQIKDHQSFDDSRLARTDASHLLVADIRPSTVWGLEAEA